MAGMPLGKKAVAAKEVTISKGAAPSFFDVSPCHLEKIHKREKKCKSLVGVFLIFRDIPIDVYTISKNRK